MSNPPLPTLALLFRLLGKVRKHLLHSLVKTLGVLICIVGKCVAGRVSPDQILGLGVKRIEDEIADLVGFSCSRCVAESSKTPPPKPS
jgi:hypothetical protein